MLDTSMEDDKENTGYFSDDERFEVDTIDDDAECNDADGGDRGQTPYCPGNARLRCEACQRPEYISSLPGGHVH